MSDKFGYEKGAKGYGELSEADRKFLKPDFDRKRQVGQKAVGMYATAARPGVANSAQLEGDDVE